MPERGVFIPEPGQPLPAQPAQPTIGRAEHLDESAPATAVEKTTAEAAFVNYIQHYLQAHQNPDRNLTVEERVRDASFNYAYERHLAARHNELSEHHWTRWVQEHVYNIRHLGPVAERAVNWGREGAYASAAGIGAKVIASHVVPTVAGFLNITGGPAAWVTGSATGAIAGGIMGYRRGGERYITKAFDSEKLRTDFGTEGLVAIWDNWRNGAHDEPAGGHPTALPPGARAEDPLYQTDQGHMGGGRVHAGPELPIDYYKQVGEALAKLDEIVDRGSLRGDFRHKSVLAEERAKLKAILETRAFFEEQAKRNEEGSPYFGGPGGQANIDQLATLWTELEATRTAHSLNERFTSNNLIGETDNVEGVTERAKRFVDEQHKIAREMSKKGAIAGALSGAVLGGVFSHFFGGHTQTTTTPSHESISPVGYGHGAISGQEGLQNALADKNFHAVSDLLQNQARLEQGGYHWDPSQVAAIDSALRQHALPPLEHFGPPGHNALLKIIEASNQNHVRPLEPIYNVLSHWDHPGNGINLDSWHQGLTNMDPSRLADINNFNDPRQLFLNHLRLLGGIHGVPASTFSSYIPAAAGEITRETVVTQGIMPAAVGYGAGEAFGQFGAKTPYLFNTVHHTPDDKEARTIEGKDLPTLGQTWEYRHGATNYNINEIFRDINAPAQIIPGDPPLHFKVDWVRGRRASVTLENPPATWSTNYRKTWEIDTDEMLKNKAFKIVNPTKQELESAKTEAEQAEKEKEEAAKEAKEQQAEAARRQETEWAESRLGQTFSYRLTVRGDGSQKNQYRTDNIITVDPSHLSWKVSITNLNDQIVGRKIKEIRDDAQNSGQPWSVEITSDFQLRIAAVDIANKRFQAEIIS